MWLRSAPARAGVASRPASLARPGQAFHGLPVRRHERSLNVRDISVSPMRGRSAAPMHVKCIGDNSASPSRPDQHLASLPIKVISLRSHATLADDVVFHTRMAHPNPARLWVCAPKGSRARKCATGPRDRKSRWVSAGTQSRGGEDQCAIRAAFSFVHFFWPNKRNGPRVQGRSHPQLAFQSPPKAAPLM
jgi:hypothetical protein